MNQCHNTASLTIATLRLSRQTENATDKQTLVRAITSLGDWGVFYRLHQAGSEDKISLRMATSSEIVWVLHTAMLCGSFLLSYPNYSTDLTSCCSCYPKVRAPAQN